jgi:small-conductance mechanosensitive channel
MSHADWPAPPAAAESSRLALLPMAGLTVSSLLAAGGALVALELAYLAYRRKFPRLLERARYQTWALSAAVWLALALGADPAPYPRVASWILFLVAVQSAYLAYRLLARLWLSQLRDARGRLAVPKLMRDLVGFVVLFVAVVWAGHGVLGLEYARFLLPSAVVSAVLGFALQDVLKNVFAGLSLQNEAPFETGDWLMMDGEARQVLEMSWRSTHLRNNLGHAYRVPNADLAAAQLLNLGAGALPMGFEVEVGVVYDAPPRQVKDALERAARNAPAVADSPAPVGLLVAFGDSGVIYRLRFWSTPGERPRRDCSIRCARASGTSSSAPASPSPSRCASSSTARSASWSRRRSPSAPRAPRRASARSPCWQRCPKRCARV